MKSDSCIWKSKLDNPTFSTEYAASLAAADMVPTTPAGLDASRAQCYDLSIFVRFGMIF